MKFVVQSPSLYLDHPIYRHVQRGFEFDEHLAKKFPVSFLEFTLKAGFIRREAEAGDEATAKTQMKKVG
jgi:hypothetical protein